MTNQTYWENGERVQISQPNTIANPKNTLDSPQLRMMRMLISNLQSSPHPALTIDALCVITGLCYEGKSMAEIARKHLVSRATVSKRCVELCKTFGIPPTRAMRTEESRKNCQKSRISKVKESIK
jgi:predicted RNA polymerase sigma factor